MSADARGEGMSRAATPLGIVAGGGTLPGRVAAAARAGGRDVFIVALDSYADPAVVGVFPHETIRVGAVGAAIAALRAAGCRELVLAGPVKRPSLLDLRPDAMGAKLLARIGRAAFAGDDGLLAAIVRVLGEEGFTVIGAHEVIGEVLAPEGLLSATAPDAAALADITRGVAVVHALGAADVGQGAVVQQGIVLAVEAVEGTDAMLARAATLRRPGPGGVLVKLVKPGQDRRADLPTLGVKTVQGVVEAGLRGIAFEAGGAILMDREAMTRAADAAGLFLLGIDPRAARWTEGRQS